MDIHKISVDLGLESLGLGVVRIVTPFTSMQCISIWSLFEVGLQLVGPQPNCCQFTAKPENQAQKRQHWFFSSALTVIIIYNINLTAKVWRIFHYEENYDTRCWCWWWRWLRCAWWPMLLLLQASADVAAVAPRTQLMLLLHACKASAGKTTIVAALSHLGFRPWIQCFVLFVM